MSILNPSFGPPPILPSPGMCSGLGRFQSGFPLGDVEGGYAAIGLAKDHYSARYVKVN